MVEFHISVTIQKYREAVFACFLPATSITCKSCNIAGTVHFTGILPVVISFV